MPTDFFTKPIDLKNDSFYEILGIKPNAELIEIKKAYRILALQYHPDKVSEEQKKEAAEEIFKALVHINETLTDPAKRSAYDRQLAVKGLEKKAPQKAPKAAGLKKDPEAAGLQKEEWLLFESFTRKLLFKINPLKENIYLGPRYGDDWSPEVSTIEVGTGEMKNIYTNLNPQEHWAFTTFISLIEERMKQKAVPPNALGRPGPKNLSPKEDLARMASGGGHSHLLFRIEVVKEIGLLYKEQGEWINELLEEYTTALNYEMCFKKLISAEFPGVITDLKTNEKGVLQFYFYHKNSDVTSWLQKNFAISSIEKDSFAGYVFPCTEFIDKLKKDQVNIEPLLQAEEENRYCQYCVDTIKAHVEIKDYTIIDKEIEKLKAKNISFSRLEEVTAAEGKRSSLLMHAITQGAPLEIIKKLVDLGSSLNYKFLHGYESSIFLQAVKYAPLEVVQYLYEKLGKPDLNQRALQDYDDESILRTAVRATKSVETLQERMNVIMYLVKQGARFSPKDRVFSEEKHRSLASYVETQIMVQTEKAEKAAAKKATAEKAPADNTAANKVAADKAAADKAAADKAAADKAAADKAAADKAAADKAAAGKAAAGKASAGKASTDKASAGKASAVKAAADKATADKATAVKAAANQVQVEDSEPTTKPKIAPTKEATERTESKHSETEKTAEQTTASAEAESIASENRTEPTSAQEATSEQTKETPTSIPTASSEVRTTNPNKFYSKPHIQSKTPSSLEALLKATHFTPEEKRKHLIAHFSKAKEPQIKADILTILNMHNPKPLSEKANMFTILHKIDSLLNSVKQGPTKLDENQKELLGYADTGLRALKIQQKTGLKLGLSALLTVLVVATIAVSMASAGIVPGLIAVAALAAAVVSMSPAAPSAFKNRAISKRLNEIDKALQTEGPESKEKLETGAAFLSKGSA